jgi:hypothetical protein
VSEGEPSKEETMRSDRRTFDGAVVVVVVMALAASTGWAQQQRPPRPRLEPKPVPTPAVPAPVAPPAAPRPALGLHLVLPQAAQPAPHLTAGALAIPTPPPGGFGIVSSGAAGGGRFFDSDGGAEAWLGSGGYGIQAFGIEGGGLLTSSDSSGYAYLGSSGWGINAVGTSGGGSFYDVDSSGHAYVGFGDVGIHAEGSSVAGYFKCTAGTGAAQLGAGNFGIVAYASEGGGYFQDSDGSGYAYVGSGNRGVEGYGSDAGGYFQETTNTGRAWVGASGYGISAYGNTMGGNFADGDSSGYAHVGVGDRGIEASGNEMGGYFKDANESGYAYVGYGDYGIRAFGNGVGGYFKDTNGSGEALLAHNDRGIEASGDDAGGYFANADSGNANVAFGDYGIYALGNTAGGYFGDLDGSGIALVGYSTYKIYGNGSVSFVQNHPTDPAAVIVYAAPEGDEVATYTRGSARLVGGEARVPLGETFKWVTNPDIGLTAHLTPHGEPVPLAVVSLTTEELVVRGPSNAPDGLVFDYLVYGLRIGFEETAVVQEKKQESYIPSMKDHRELLARRPDLARYTALARYSSERQAMGVTEEFKLDRANALKAAIHEFDPAVDKVEVSQPPEISARPGQPGQEGAGTHAATTARPISLGADLVPSERTVPALPAVIGGESQDIRARSFSSPREQVATRLTVSGDVEPGDVLVVDREHPQLFARGDRSADPTVVGVVVADAGVALGAQGGEGPSAPVALSGIARCKVDATFGAIMPGDLLVSSPTPGHAMREASPLPGTVVGKALEPLASGHGSIRILVMLH